MYKIITFISILLLYIGTTNTQANTSIDLTQKKIVILACKNNLEAEKARFDLDINKLHIDVEEGIFEPDAILEYKHSRAKNQNGADEFFDRSYQDLYESRNDKYSFSLRGLFPIGTKWNFDFTLIDNWDTMVQQRYSGEQDQEYKWLMNISINQPLLKGAGLDANKYKIYLAEIEKNIVLEKLKLSLMQLSVKAIDAYWDLYYTQSNLDLLRKSVALATTLLRVNRAKEKSGKISKVEVYEAEAGLARRRSQFILAENALVSANNRILQILSKENNPEPVAEAFKAKEGPKIYDGYAIDYNSSLDRAYANWPEYQTRQLAIQSELIKVGFYENQCLPDLSLDASYGVSGLHPAFHEANYEMRTFRYPSWTVGLKFTTPIFGGQSEQKELQKAEKRVLQAKNALKSIEIALKHGIRSKISLVESLQKNTKSSINIVELKKKILEAEKDKFRFGKSRTSILLDKEEKLNDAYIELLRNKIELEKSVSQLRLAEGILLSEYGIKIE